MGHQQNGTLLSPLEEKREKNGTEKRYRGNVGRNLLAQKRLQREIETDKAVKIQAAIRGKIDRNKVAERRRQIAEKHEKATKLQATWKGKMDRKEVEKKKALKAAEFEEKVNKT